MPDEGDIYGMMGMAPDAAMQARALAAALRRQQTLGALGTLAGQTPVGQMGATIAQEATQGQNRLMQGAQHGQELMARLAEAKQARDERDQFNRDKLAQAAQLQAAALGLKADEIGVDAFGRFYRKHAGRGGASGGNPLRGVGATQPTSTPTGQPGAASAPGGQPAPAPEDQESPPPLMKPGDINKAWTELTKNISKFTGRANLNAANQKRLQSGDRLAALIQAPDGSIQNLNPQMVRLAATDLANLISNGQISEKQVEELVPNTLAGKWAQLKQKVLNKPQGEDAQAFLQQIIDTVKREHRVVGGQILEGQASFLPNYAHLRQRDPKRFNNILRGAGIDPGLLDKNLLLKKEQPEGGTAGAGDATTAVGAERQVRMKAPDGSTHLVPASKVKDATAAGGQVIPNG